MAVTPKQLSLLLTAISAANTFWAMPLWIVLRMCMLHTCTQPHTVYIHTYELWRGTTRNFLEELRKKYYCCK
jgi:hypothetical protein